MNVFLRIRTIQLILYYISDIAKLFCECQQGYIIMIVNMNMWVELWISTLNVLYYTYCITDWQSLLSWILIRHKKLSHPIHFDVKQCVLSATTKQWYPTVWFLARLWLDQGRTHDIRKSIQFLKGYFASVTKQITDDHLVWLQSYQVTTWLN